MNIPNLFKFGTREKPSITFAGRPKPKSDTEAIPSGVAGGRDSTPESMSLLGFLTNEMAQVEPDFELELIRLIEHLAKYNGDVSYAVDNVVQLANTPYSIYFGDEVDEKLAKEMALICKEGEGSAYNGKLNALINDLLAQAVITGAVSGEVVPNDKLDDVLRIVLVATGSIKFLYDTKTVNYMPYQKSAVTLVNKLGVGNLTKLNPVTYKYYALRRFGEKPYAIPPLLSALEAIAIEKDMIKGLKSIVKKLGVFGFMTMLITPPKRKVGMGEVESDEAYWKRCEAHLEMVRKEAEKGFASGLVLGFKDSHEIKLENTLANMTGTSELFKLVGEFKFAGLKQDPLMLGRNYNVAETMARVILAKLTTQIANYQLTVASFLEDYFRLKLLLRGYNKIGNLKVEFERAMVSDKKMEEDAYGKRIQNQRELYADGVIDQETRANALGFEQAAEKEPRPGFDKEGKPIPPGENMPEGKQDPTVTKDKRAARVTNSNTQVEEVLVFDREEMLNLAMGFGSAVPQFSYGTCGGTTRGIQHFATQKEMYAALDEYFSAVRSVYDKAAKNLAKAAIRQLNSLPPEATNEMRLDNIMYTLYKNWNRSYAKPVKNVVQAYVDDTYRRLRDKAVVMNQRDLNIIEYFRKSDSLYLTKFITDTDTRNKMREFANASSFSQASLEAALQDLDWKITRVLTTSVNKMANFAALNQMDASKVKTFEVRGVNDAVQCATCKAMQGRKFSVATALAKVDREISNSPEYVSATNPFATSRQYTSQDLESMSDADIQLSGIDTPPYHGNCRDRIYEVNG